MSDNSGIQVFNGNVTGEVIAAGNEAKATKIIGSDPRVADALGELRVALEQLSLSRQEKESLASDLERVDAASKQGDPAATTSGLQSFADKLAKAGIVVKETLALAKP